MKKRLKCKKCGESWEPRKKDELPVACPRCKSVFWNGKRRAA